MITIDILTLFPNFFTGTFSESIIKRAQEKNAVHIAVHQLRDWAEDERGTVDDTPFGGGPGMLMKVEPLSKAIEALSEGHSQTHTILMTPQGGTFTQKRAEELATMNGCHFILICGHYEGVDERVRTTLIDEEISIGDYVLTGGEIPAMVVTDAIVRLLPGVLKKDNATSEESFNLKDEEGRALLEYPQYTKPQEFRGMRVPDVLLSGNHAEIEKWQQEQAKKRTAKNRPDLLS